MRKADGNFVSEFECFNIGENLYTGAYPDSDLEIRKLRSIGVTAVLNLQTDEQKTQQNVDILEMGQFHKAQGILLVNHPLSDAHPEAYLDGLYQGCLILQDLLEEQDHCVYVHCTTGISRAPTLIASYLCLFIKHPDWQFPTKVIDFLVSCSANCIPNERALKQIVASR